jgi:hypothetical protein
MTVEKKKAITSAVYSVFFLAYRPYLSLNRYILAVSTATAMATSFRYFIIAFGVFIAIDSVVCSLDK